MTDCRRPRPLRGTCWRGPGVAAFAVLLVTGCSSPGDGAPTAADAAAQEAANTAVTVCIGTGAGHAVGDSVPLVVESDGVVLTATALQVPDQVVLRIPSSAHEPRLLVDGREWASSPRGGGWGIGAGEGCSDLRPDAG